MAIFLGVGLLSAAILVAPVEANKTKKWPKSVSQEVTYGQAMQKPGMFEKTERRGIQKLSRVEVVRVLPENRKGQFMADLRGVLYTSLGTDAFTVRYASELAMILANAQQRPDLVTQFERWRQQYETAINVHPAGPKFLIPPTWF